ncbi:MAG: porin, partial [Nitrospinaceae bacterium]
NFDGEGGWGALQVALRYSTLDLNDDNSAPAYRGGEMDNITLGLNWHLNPNTRFMFNYVHSMVDSGAVPSTSAGNLNIFQARFQIDF